MVKGRTHGRTDKRARKSRFHPEGKNTETRDGSTRGDTSSLEDGDKDGEGKPTSLIRRVTIDRENEAAAGENEFASQPAISTSIHRACKGSQGRGTIKGGKRERTG